MQYCTVEPKAGRDHRSTLGLQESLMKDCNSSYTKLSGNFGLLVRRRIQISVIDNSWKRPCISLIKRIRTQITFRYYGRGRVLVEIGDYDIG